MCLFGQNFRHGIQYGDGIEINVFLIYLYAAGKFKDDPIEKQIQFGSSPTNVVDLPVGPPIDGHNVTIYARIIDQLDAATTEQIGTVKVRKFVNNRMYTMFNLIEYNTTLNNIPQGTLTI